MVNGGTFLLVIEVGPLFIKKKQLCLKNYTFHIMTSFNKKLTHKPLSSTREEHCFFYAVLFIITSILNHDKGVYNEAIKTVYTIVNNFFYFCS